jgi:hypothetical protein
MKKINLLIVRATFSIFIMVLVGCATTSRKVVIKPSDKLEWSIFAKASNGYFSDQISIFINDKEIFNGSVTMFSPHINFSETYEGRKIDADCSAMGPLHKCDIFIDGTKITELSF